MNNNKLTLRLANNKQVNVKVGKTTTAALLLNLLGISMKFSKVFRENLDFSAFFVDIARQFFDTAKSTIFGGKIGTFGLFHLVCSQLGEAQAANTV